MLWPIPSWINFWGGVTPPVWWSKLMMPTDFLFFALLFLLFAKLARKQNTDTGYLRTISIWTYIQLALFVVFTVLVYTMQKGFMTPYGAIYLLSLGLAFAVTIRMRETIETTGPQETVDNLRDPQNASRLTPAGMLRLRLRYAAWKVLRLQLCVHSGQDMVCSFAMKQTKANIKVGVGDLLSQRS